MNYPEHNPERRPPKGADGRCWECGEVLVNVGKEYATCGHCDVKLVPRFPPSYLRMIASGQTYFTRKSNGKYRAMHSEKEWTSDRPGSWFDETVMGWSRWGTGYRQRRFYRLKEKK